MTAPASERVKILPLTSVRFFAAFMIVLAHSSASGLFGFQFSEQMHYVLGAGVSFFFVLSGFIITHTYGELDSRAEIAKFWSARFSRIWPTHALTFLLCLVLIPPQSWVPGGAALGPALANITLTQSLFAVPQYYFSFNAPSWSISTEAYFYLAYPLAVMMLAWRTWAPLLLAAVLVCVMISVALILDVPSYTDATLTQSTVHGLISVHPITRFFEFACGMSVAAIWPYLKERAVAYGTGTLLEITAGLLAVISIVAMQNVGVSLSARGLPEAVTMWIRLGAAAIPFAAFVLVLSLEIGALARVLSTKLLVVLGEASFAMYMLHQLILRYLVDAGLRATVPDWLMFGVFCAGIVVSSYVVWVAVERPSRTLLNRLFARLARG